MCPTLCDPMDCSLPGSSIHGIFQAGVLEWAVIVFSTFYRSGLNAVDGLVAMAVLTPHPHPCLDQSGAKWALCRSLLAGMGHKTAWYNTLQSPEASVGPPMGWPGIQDKCLWALGSLIKCWPADGQSLFITWLTAWPGMSPNSFSSLVSGAGSHSDWLRGPHVSKLVSYQPGVGRARFWVLQLHSPGGPRAEVGWCLGVTGWGQLLI